MVIRYAGAVVLIAVLLIAWTLSHTAPPYSTDSYAFVELSQSISVDFYRVHTYRAFQTDALYSISFPPLWPSVIWLVDRLIGPYIYTGYLTSFLLVLALAGISEIIATRHFFAPGAGILSVVVLLFYMPFLDNVLSGHSISLSVLLIAILFWLLLSHRNSNKGRFVIGLTAGLLVMTRFDSIPVAFAIIVLVGLVERDWKAVVITLTGSFLCVVPWVVYCLTRFGVFFLSDNSLIASSIDPDAYVTDFYSVPPITWRDEPMAWIAKLMSHLPYVLDRMTKLPGKSALIPLAVLAVITIENPFKTSKLTTPERRWWPSIAIVLLAPVLMTYPYAYLYYPEGFTPLLKLLFLIALFAFPGVLIYVMWGHLRTVTIRSVVSDTVIIVVGMVLAVLAAFPAYLVTGYAQYRYFSPIIWLLGFLLLAFLIRQLKKNLAVDSKRLSAMLVAMIGIVTITQTWFHVRSLGLESHAVNKRHDDEATLLQHCIYARHEQRYGTLLLLRDDILAARLGATTDLITALKPRNFERLDDAERRQFLQKYQISYVYFTAPEYKDLLTGVTQLDLLPECSLEVYKVNLNS